jgi:phospholipase C
VAGKCTGSDWVNNVDTTPSDILTDIANCNLRQVNWVIPDGKNSDHAAPGNTGGPAWIASIVNAIGNSYSNSAGACDYWGANKPGDETAFMVTWDDWGGWYDHEPATLLPFPQGGYQDGIRVPLVVASAYTPVKYIGNNVLDFGSIIRFVEQNYGIQEGALTFADSRSTNDLTDFFNLNQTPRIFVTIASPKGADYFIHDTSLPTDPDDE